MKRIIKEQVTKIIIEKSKFISHCYNCDSINDMNSLIKKERQINHSANHVCYACVVLEDGVKTYFNDDGEPSGTAGLQILQVLKENDLINTLITVVRYFGGIKLGIPGLSRAYKNIANMCIKDNVCSVKLKSLYMCKCEYRAFDNVKKLLEKYNIEIIELKFLNEIKFYVYLDDEEYSKLCPLVLDLQNQNKTRYCKI